MDAAQIIRKRLQGVEPTPIPELDIEVFLLEPGALHFMDFNTVVEDLKDTPDQKQIVMKDLDPSQQRRWVEAMMELIVGSAYNADGTPTFADTAAVGVLPRGAMERLVNTVPFGSTESGPG